MAQYRELVDENNSGKGNFGGAVQEKEVVD
jgi:hypothetical protein